MTTDSIPPTEPSTATATATVVTPSADVLPPKAPKATAPRSPKSKRSVTEPVVVPKRRSKAKPKKADSTLNPKAISGSELIPDLSKHADAMSEEVFFWVGLTIDAPVEHLTVGGVRLSKHQQRLVRNAADPRKKDRVPVYGGIARLTRQGFNDFCEQMSRTVFRFHAKDSVQEEEGTGQNMGDVHIRPRRGYPIQIPGAKLIAERKAMGKSVRPYRASQLDEAAAAYVYAEPCQNQIKPMRQNEAPDVLSEVGIVWPGK